MHASDKSGELARRKQVRLRLRPNLVFTTQEHGGGHVVKDPVSMRYFRLEETQRFIVELMDGNHSLAQIQKAYEEKFRPQRLTLDELEAFASQLLEAGLAQNESPLASELFFERRRRTRRPWWLALANIFYLKVPLVDPDRFLGRLGFLGRTLFHPLTVLLGLLVLLGAVGLVVTHWRDFVARLPSYQEFFSWHSVLFVWVTLGVVKVLHELGHALCCKAMGGEVHEMGVVFLFFFPTLYCNVSDSWTLPSKWKRMAISAAGIYVELWLAALAAFAWWSADPGSVVHRFSFALMLVCGLQTLLCNANPLMRFDGYHVLADWLEVPNLAQQSTRCLRDHCKHVLGMRFRTEQPRGKMGPGFLACFGLASLIYRTFVLILALYFLNQFFVHHRLAFLGWFMVAVCLAGLAAPLVFGLLRTLSNRGRLPDMKPSRSYLLLATLGVLVFVFFAFPFPRKVRGLALVQPDPSHARRVVVPESGGLLEECLVRDGQAVKAGDVLALLSNPKLEIKVRLNEADQALKRRQQDAQIGQIAAEESSEDQGFEALQSEVELQGLLREHAALKEQKDRLVLRAPCDGVVMGLVHLEEKGRWLEKGAEICHVGNPRLLRAVVVLEPAEHKLVCTHAPAELIIHGAGSRHWRVVVSGVSQVEVQKIPPQLSRRAGGDVMTRQDPNSRTEKPEDQQYLVSLRLLETDPLMHPGVLGRVRIEADSETLWQRTRRFLANTLSWGL